MKTIDYFLGQEEMRIHIPKKKQKMQKIFSKRFLTSSCRLFDKVPKQSPYEWFEEKVYNVDLKTLPAKVPRWMDKSNLQKQRQPTKTQTGQVEKEEIIMKLKEMQCIDLNVIDVRGRVDHFDTVIICEGRSTRHVYSIADSIRIMVNIGQANDRYSTV
jgi:Ribosomal silencing factor during starvation